MNRQNRPRRRLALRLPLALGFLMAFLVPALPNPAFACSPGELCAPIVIKGDQGGGAIPPDPNNPNPGSGGGGGGGLGPSDKIVYFGEGLFPKQPVGVPPAMGPVHRPENPFPIDAFGQDLYCPGGYCPSGYAQYYDQGSPCRIYPTRTYNWRDANGSPTRQTVYPSGVYFATTVVLSNFKAKGSYDPVVGGPSFQYVPSSVTTRYTGCAFPSVDFHSRDCIIQAGPFNLTGPFAQGYPIMAFDPATGASKAIPSTVSRTTLYTGTYTAYNGRTESAIFVTSFGKAYRDGGPYLGGLSNGRKMALVDNCATELTYGFLLPRLPDFGNYSMRVSGNKIQCSYVTFSDSNIFTGAGTDETIFQGCGRNPTTVYNRSPFHLPCSKIPAAGYDNSSYAEAANWLNGCDSTPPDCTANFSGRLTTPPNFVNGGTRTFGNKPRKPVQAAADGRAWTLKFRAPTVSGATATNKSMTFVVSRNSTPMDPDAPAAGSDTQPFVGKVGTRNALFFSGDNSRLFKGWSQPLTLRLYRAGQAGKPFKISAYYKFDYETKTGGAISGGTVTRSATCQSKPYSISAVAVRPLP